MSQLNLNLPIIGEPNATEDPKVRTALSDIQTVVNSLDNANIAANADINGSKLLNASVAAAKLVAGILPPAGALMPYAGSTAPTGYLLCEGQAVNRTTYANLFSAISTTYGVGDGSTTFNLPDLRGRMPVGKGTHTSVDALGENDGTAVENRRPAHSHTGTTESAGAHTHTIDLTGPFFGNGWNISQGSNISASGLTTSSNGNHTHNVTVGSTGGTTDAPSFVVVNYIIKT